MGKKIKFTGAPPYMAQYTALMTIMLGLFYTSGDNVITKKKNPVFRKALEGSRTLSGLQGGLGMFKYTFFGRGGAKTPNPAESGEKEFQGLHDDMIKSDGGSGNTDADLKDRKINRFLRIKIPDKFPQDSSLVPADMAKYLAEVGIGFSLFDYKLTIKCFSNETGNRKKDVDLAARRAAQIMRYLHQRCGVSYAKMRSAGYPTSTFFEANGKGVGPHVRQGAYFYIFMKAKKQ